MELIVAVFGTIISVSIAVLGAVLSLRSNIILKNRNLKESHYTDYLEKLHNLASENKSPKAIIEYTKARDKLFIIANEHVVKALISYEEKAVGKVCNKHDEYLTQLIIEIRKDLKIKDTNFRTIYLKK